MAASIVADEESCLHTLAVGSARVSSACGRQWAPGGSCTCSCCTCRCLHPSNSNAPLRGSFGSCRGAACAWARRCVGGRGAADLLGLGRRRSSMWDEACRTYSEREGWQCTARARCCYCCWGFGTNQTVPPLLLTFMLTAREKKANILWLTSYSWCEKFFCQPSSWLHAAVCPAEADLWEPNEVNECCQLKGASPFTWTCERFCISLRVC